MKSGKQRQQELNGKRAKARDAANEQQREAASERQLGASAQCGCKNPEFIAIPRPVEEDYADYVEHPRCGKAPRYTGFDPNPNSPWVNLHWNTGYTSGKALRRLRHFFEFSWIYSSIKDRKPELVPGTAICADLTKQTRATNPVTHYYDIDHRCVDCGKRFIFFAEEQRYWYEELGFGLESQAVRCPPCRKQQQLLDRARRRYEELFHISPRSVEETLAMVDCCLTLVEAGAFNSRQKEHVRVMLMRLPDEAKSLEAFVELSERLGRLGGAN